MAEVRVKWIEGLHFMGTDSTRHSIVLSPAEEGRGIGMKPSELLLIALGGCTGVDVVDIMRKKRQQMTGLEIGVSGAQDPDPPWTFRPIHAEYVARGRALSEKALTDAIRLSEEKYCSVMATVRGVAEVTSGYRIVEET